MLGLKDYCHLGGNRSSSCYRQEWLWSVSWCIIRLGVGRMQTTVKMHSQNLTRQKRLLYYNHAHAKYSWNTDTL